MVATALRETREELGITVAPERVWGTLKPLRDAVSLLLASLRSFLLSREDKYHFLFSPVCDDDCSCVGESWPVRGFILQT